MNLKGIFLVNCLVVLFFCVKGSAEEVYGVLNASVLLNIPELKEKNPYETRWMKNKTLVMKMKDSKKMFYGTNNSKKFDMLPNGTLKMDQLAEEDRGTYTVEVYDANGRQLMDKKLSLNFQEILSKPEIKWICSKKTTIVTCEVNQKTKPTFQLLQNNRSLTLNVPKQENGKWKIEYKDKVPTAKYQCEVKNNVSKSTEEKEIKCAGLDLLLILSIAGGAVVFVIFLALLIYCIRKKRAERAEELVADEEILMQMQREDNELKQRPLPQPPGHGPQKQPRQQRRPLPQSQPPHQEAPPRPRPRTQPKSPNHMKDRP